jgi:hypothetical protein
VKYNWKEVESVTPRYNLRPRRNPINWSTMFAVFLTNLSLKRGLQLYGHEARQAIVTEMVQLHNKNVFEGVKYNTLNAKQKRKILKTLLMFLKKNRDGRMKARACVDGRKQSMFELEIDLASPTVSLESLMLSCVIDANERRHVVTADIERAYLAVDIDEDAIIELDQILANVLTSVDSSKCWLCTKCTIIL